MGTVDTRQLGLMRTQVFLPRLSMEALIGTGELEELHRSQSGSLGWRTEVAGAWLLLSERDRDAFFLERYMLGRKGASSGLPSARPPSLPASPQL